MSKLVLVDSIPLATRLGTSDVQLYLGDITCLPVEEKVDIIFTSAFPNDYIETPGTLIWALAKNLDIHVQRLAERKDLDLRVNFSCWMSSPLEAQLPYRRLVCFEINRRGGTVTEQMSMVFRAMMPIFNSTESSIITPLLATGCQGAHQEDMLRVMVDTACHWIKAGLPLKCLKLVLYTQDPEKSRKMEHKKTIEVFSSLKNKWLKKEKGKAKMERYDIAFSFENKDQNYVELVSKELKKQNPKLKIHKSVFVANTSDSWQDQVFNVLANSRRVLIILTQAYVSDAFCLEQFSLALCCNRLQGGRGVVIPLLMETVQGLPSYLNLVQYTDCRVRKEGETQDGKISAACTDIVSGIDDAKKLAEDSQAVQSGKPSPAYDIFVSYSHRDPELARTAVDMLAAHHPQVMAFFDRSELKTGNIWQHTLYEAVNRTRCFLAFVCDSYLSSTVCQEEFNIALGRTVAKDGLLLIPVCLPSLTALPASFRQGHHVKVADVDQLKLLVEQVVRALKGQPKAEIDVEPLKKTLAQKHSKDFEAKYKLSENYEVLPKEGAKVERTATKAQVTFSYAHDGLKYAAILSELLKDEAPDLTTTLLSAGDNEARTAIDQSDMTVLFVSDDFLRSQHHMQELHMALCKQRTVKDSTVVYLVEINHASPDPLFTHLLPYHMNLDEPLWATLTSKCIIKTVRSTVHTEGLQGTYSCLVHHHTALKAAAQDILSFLADRGKGSSIPLNVLNVNKIRNLLKSGNTEDTTVPVEKIAVSVQDLALDKNMQSFEDNCLDPFTRKDEEIVEQKDNETSAAGTIDEDKNIGEQKEENTKKVTEKDPNSGDNKEQVPIQKTDKKTYEKDRDSSKAAESDSQKENMSATGNEAKQKESSGKSGNKKTSSRSCVVN